MYIMNESFYIDYLRIKLRWIREMRKPSSYSINGLKFPYTLIWLVLDGTLELNLDGNRVEASRGDLIIFRPDTLLSLLPRKDDSRIHYLSLYADLKIGSLDLVNLYKLPLLTNQGHAPALESFARIWTEAVDAFEKLGRIVIAEPPDHRFAATRSFQFHTDASLQFLELQANVYRWLHHFLSLMRPSLPDEPLLFDSRVMNVCDYIQQHLHEPISLNRLAKHAHLSAGHLSHLFMKTFGTSPIDYVQKTRVHAAKELLMNSSYTIKDIADMLGFPDQSQFSRMFRKEEGVSPKRYRQSIVDFLFK